MGLIARLIGSPAGAAALASAANGVVGALAAGAQPPVPAARGAAADAGAGGQVPEPGPFDSMVDGLNRLPRPMLALGTLGLFGYAMIDPEGFGARMVGLGTVPEPLWWLLGAIVSFYFGAREAHYFRARTAPPAPAEPPAVEEPAPPTVAPSAPDAVDPPDPQGGTASTPEPLTASPARGAGRGETATPLSGNAALDEWRRLSRD
jgi:hypothetical protein